MTHVQRAAIVSTTGGLVLLVIGSFMPWARSGTRQRSSYELVRVADRLDLLPGGWQAGAARAWFAVPLVAVLAATAPLWRPPLVRRAGSIAAVLVSVFALVLVVIVHRSPLSTDVGATTSAIGATVTLCGACVMALLTTQLMPAPVRR